MTVAIYDCWSTAVQELGTLWCSLLENEGFNPTLHPTWLAATLASFKQLDSTRVAIVRAKPDCVAIIPFFIRRRTLCGVPLRCLELASNVFCYHGEIVSSGDLNELLQMFLNDERVPAWDALRAENIVAGGRTARAIRALDSRLTVGLSAMPGERSPFAVLDGDWNAYLGTRTKKVRANVLRSQRLMRDAGETGMAWYEGRSDTTRLLAEMLAIEARSWKAGAGVDIVEGSPQHEYYRRLLPWLSDNDKLMANVLYINNEPSAYVLCADWNGWVGQLKTSFLAGLGDAGSRVVHASLERAFERKAREYDFLGDLAPHKTRWADSIRDHEEFWTFGRHLRGRMFARFKAISDMRQRLKKHNNSSIRRAAGGGAQP